MPRSLRSDRRSGIWTSPSCAFRAVAAVGNDPILRLGHGLAHDRLEVRIDRDLGLICLHEPVRRLHDARLGIGEVELFLRLRLAFLPRVALALGLYPCSLLQCAFSLPNLLDPRFPPGQLRWQFIAPAVAP
jgi:hypothetical protein